MILLKMNLYKYNKYFNNFIIFAIYFMNKCELYKIYYILR